MKYLVLTEEEHKGLLKVLEYAWKDGKLHKESDSITLARVAAFVRLPYTKERLLKEVLGKK